ncbi:MAG TPA: sigma-70 family RNA polymerase sigma factor [Polyangia bacterium]|jgi:RNA polymerase sigma-70 factor (ECF subfamily)|nr:sigma-70 family RNA polymerase sigma factor [Polyangia bacterium]
MATDDSAELMAQLAAHRKILFKVARLYCANDADREELTQDIVVQLWRSFARFDGRSTFATWMYRIALNVAISRVRQERRRPRHMVPLDDAVLETTRVAQQEDGDFADVAALLGRLDALDRALVLLHLEGHDHDAIATILGISVSNVGTKLHRLKQRLRQALAANE